MPSIGKRQNGARTSNHRRRICRIVRIHKRRLNERRNRHSPAPVHSPIGGVRMNVSGIPLSEWREIVRVVSDLAYDGNVIVHDDTHTINAKGDRFTGRLRVSDSRGVGARTSWSGRRTPSACWHAYRDVLRAAFTLYPNARIRTALSVYRGLEGFESAYPETGNRNIGSQMNPAYMPELCECYGEADPALTLLLEIVRSNNDLRDFDIRSAVAAMETE